MTSVSLRGVDFALEQALSASARASAVPFVWGHGLTSSMESEDDRPLVDAHALAQDRPVVRYDARGHGRSGALGEPSEGDWAELALDQIALIDHLGLDEVALGGASMGTATALHSAAMLGDRVRALVLAIPPTAWESRATQVDLYEQMASIVESKGVDPLIAAQRVNPPPDPFLADADEYYRQAEQRLRAIEPARLAMAFRGAGTADLPARATVATLAQPTLVLAWSGDAGHPVSTATQLGELMPNAEVIVSSTATELDRWTELTRAFLAEHTA